MGGIFWEEFFGKNFLEEVLEGIFGRFFLGGFFGMIFWEDFFWKVFFRMNSLLTLLKLFEYKKGLICLSRFWFLSRRKEERKEGRKNFNP